MTASNPSSSRRSRNRFSLVLDMAVPGPRVRERNHKATVADSTSRSTYVRQRSPLAPASHINSPIPSPTSTPSSPPYDRPRSGVFATGGDQNSKRKVSDDLVSPTKRLRSLLSPRPSLHRAALTAPGSPTFSKSPTSTVAPSVMYAPFDILTPTSPDFVSLDERASIASRDAFSTGRRSTDPLLTTTMSPAASPPPPHSTLSLAISVMGSPSSAETVPPQSPYVPDHTVPQSPLSMIDDGSSIISYIPRAPDPVVQQQTRLLKLARQFGENIPAELVRSDPSSSPSTFPPPNPMPTTPHPRPQRLQRAHPARRLSLDMSVLFARKTPGITPSSSSPLRDQQDQVHQTLKRSRSMWMRMTLDNSTTNAQHYADAGPSTTERLDQAHKSPVGTPLPQMTERQRLANVRRARKMTELFGDEPPPALFQITTPDAVPPSPVVSTHRHSFATFVSTTTDANALLTPLREKRASLLTTSDGGASILTISDGRRTSILTVVSLSSGEGPGPRKLSRRHSSVDINVTVQPSTPAAPRAPHTPTLKNFLVGVAGAPPSPPPFADVQYRPASPPSVPAAAFTPTSSAEVVPRERTHAKASSVAWRRRRQAAKLAHFFGVESRDIDPAFTTDVHSPLPAAAAPAAAPTTPALQASMPRAATPARPQTPALPLRVGSPALERQSSEMLVDVRVRAPARLWGGGVRETDDMRDAITRLRSLRAS